MFNACRRGPASLSRVLRTTASSTRISCARPLTLSLSLQRSTGPALQSRCLHASSQLRNQNAAAISIDGVADEVDDINGQQNSATITRFDQLEEYNLVHPNVVRAITKGMGHQTMTEVQTATINQALQGTDIIAQARTGTGKTLGFLVPTIQNIISKNPDLALRQQRYSSRARPSDIRAIIISPTRELAEQIAVEAVKLTKNTDLIVQVAVGGNSKRFMLQKTQREGCHILVATPGRLNDLLTDKYSKIAAPRLTTLVLDEADRLLDDGFAGDIEAIIDLLPDRRLVDRQTLLFSATIPREVMGLVRRTLKPDFSFVETVKEGDVATHESVPQKIVTLPGLENFMPTLLELSKRETQKAASAGSDGNPFKAIVYFSSTANVELAASVFENLKGEGGDMFSRHPLYPAQIFEMHGKLTQAERTRTSERFRKAKSAILFSSDVTARGMDFPGVTHVIQIGLPPNRDQYIHRIGRTGRAGRVGEGWTFITQGELREARSLLRGLPISPDKTLEASQVDMTRDAQLPASLAKILSQAGEATKMVSRGTKVKAYLAHVGQLGRNPRLGAAELNQWTRYGWGWEQPPAVDPRLAQKLGLSRVEGMNIGTERDRDDNFGESEDRGFGNGRSGFGARAGGFGGQDRGRSGRFGGGGRGAGFGRSDYSGRGNGGGRSREPLASF